MGRNENEKVWCYRGESRYHYFGIRIIPGSAQSRLADVGASSAVDQQPSSCKHIKFSGPSGGVTQNIEEHFGQNAVRLASSRSCSSSPEVHDQAQFKVQRGDRKLT
jgi:hypothetical protein